MAPFTVLGIPAHIAKKFRANISIPKKLIFPQKQERQRFLKHQCCRAKFSIQEVNIPEHHPTVSLGTLHSMSPTRRSHPRGRCHRAPFVCRRRRRPQRERTNQKARRKNKGSLSQRTGQTYKIKHTKRRTQQCLELNANVTRLQPGV